MSDVVLRTQHLTKRYGSLTAVKDLSLDVYAGEIFGFLGPNGAGKTTSINMMCGLLKPDSGAVFIHGAPLNGTDARARTHVGVCPQQIVLWEKLTCLEQLQFIGEMYGVHPKTARQRAERLLLELDLAEKRHKLSRTLSGGMQRRLNLAMALVHDPAIIVLDEPEAGLDPQSRIIVREYVQSLAHRKTVILTTHNMDEADRLADRLAIIDHGELLVVDTPAALKQRLGSGDVIVFNIADDAEWEAKTRRAADTLKGTVEEVSLNPAVKTMRLRALHAVGLLPKILAVLTSAGLHTTDINIHANTLEDVFIQLTGRGLRE